MRSSSALAIHFSIFQIKFYSRKNAGQQFTTARPATIHRSAEHQIRLSAWTKKDYYVLHAVFFSLPAIYSAVAQLAQDPLLMSITRAHLSPAPGPVFHSPQRSNPIENSILKVKSHEMPFYVHVLGIYFYWLHALTLRCLIRGPFSPRRSPAPPLETRKYKFSFNKTNHWLRHGNPLFLRLRCLFFVVLLYRWTFIYNTTARCGIHIAHRWLHAG